MASPAAGRVIDADLHVRELLPKDAIADRLDEPHRSHLRMSREFGDVDARTFYGDWEVYVAADLEPPPVPDREAFLEAHLPAKGVDAAVVNAFAYLSRRPTTEYATALMPAINDVLIEELLDPHDDLYGLAELAVQRPAAAAAEVERLAGEDGIVGVLVGTTGLFPPPGDPKYDVVYRAAEDAGLPVVFHPDATHGFDEEFPNQRPGFETYAGVKAVAGPWTGMNVVTDLIEKGTPEKFPDLDFVFLETDFTIAPYLMFRMNRDYGIRSKQLPMVREDPEVYVRDAFHFGTHPLPADPEAASAVIEILDDDALLFATGAPEYDEDTPERFESLLADRVPADVRGRILSTNAAAVFGIGV